MPAAVDSQAADIITPGPGLAQQNSFLGSSRFAPTKRTVWMRPLRIPFTHLPPKSSKIAPDFTSCHGFTIPAGPPSSDGFLSGSMTRSHGLTACTRACHK